MKTLLGLPLLEERGYRVREVFDPARDACSIGFTFEGPGFNALIIYPNFDEAVQGLRSMFCYLGDAGEERR